jgi:hypothetical protein
LLILSANEPRSGPIGRFWVRLARELLYFQNLAAVWIISPRFTVFGTGRFGIDFLWATGKIIFDRGRSDLM